MSQDQIYVSFVGSVSFHATKTDELCLSLFSLPMNASTLSKVIFSMEVGNRVSITGGVYKGHGGVVDGVTNKKVTIRLDKPIRTDDGTTKTVVTILQRSVCVYAPIANTVDTALIAEMEELKHQMNLARSAKETAEAQLASKTLEHEQNLKTLNRTINHQERALLNKSNVIKSFSDQLKSKGEEIEGLKKGKRKVEAMLVQQERDFDSRLRELDFTTKQHLGKRKSDQYEPAQTSPSVHAAKRRRAKSLPSSECRAHLSPSAIAKASPCDNSVLKHKFPPGPDWKKAEKIVRQGGWKKDRNNGHPVFKRSIAVLQPQTLVIASTPSSQRSGKRVVAKLLEMNEVAKKDLPEILKVVQSSNFENPLATEI